jgi:PAS domain S-box-containing protein
VQERARRFAVGAVAGWRAGRRRGGARGAERGERAAAARAGQVGRRPGSPDRVGRLRVFDRFAYGLGSWDEQPSAAPGPHQPHIEGLEGVEPSFPGFGERVSRDATTGRNEQLRGVAPVCVSRDRRRRSTWSRHADARPSAGREIASAVQIGSRRQHSCSLLRERADEVKRDLGVVEICYPPGVDVELPRFVAESPIATWLCDRSSLEVRVANAAAIAALGRDDLIGTSLRALWIDPAAAETSLAKAARDRTLARWTQRTSAGAAIEVEAAVTAHEDAWLVQAVRVGALAPDPDVVARLGALVERLPDAIGIHDRDGRCVYMSPAVRQILGREPEDFIGTVGSRHSHPEDVERARPIYRELLDQPGAARTFVTRVRDDNERARWLEATVTNLLDEPSVRGVVTIFRDVSERVEAQAALEDARRRFAYLLSATSAITFTATVEPPHRVTFMSENVLAVLGYRPEQIVGNPQFWADRVHPDDGVRRRTTIASTLETGRVVVEYRFRHADGSYRWLHSDGHLIHGVGGKPAEIVGVTIDVTARREAELAMRREDANLRALIENAPLAIVVHRDDRIVYVNGPLVALCGYASPNDLIGRSPFVLIAPESHDGARVRMGQIATGASRTPLAEGAMLRADGSTVAVEVEAMRLDFDGAPASVVLMRDISERKAMVARLATSDRLASVGTLAAGVAHEINNPLAFVLTNLAMLADLLPAILDGRAAAQLRGAEIEGILRDAREGASRIRALVNDLRSLSHPDQTSESRVELRGVMETCLRMAENELRHRARLVTRWGDVPDIDGNASRVGQLFLNLLINAAQAIPEGRVADHEVRVTLRRGPGGHAVVEMSDTGGGIPPAIRGRIFDPFFTTKPVGQGTGLGLAICHRIVESMGGEIEVDSEVGRGTTFRVILPPARGTASATAPDPAAPPLVARRRVLVIDDEAAIGRSLGGLLGVHHDVVVMTRAAEALPRIAAGETFDVILCDLMMPEMSGMAFHAKVEAIAPEVARRVVFLTGGAFTPAAREFLARVPNVRLEKPFDAADVFRVVEVTA